MVIYEFILKELGDLVTSFLWQAVIPLHLVHHEFFILGMHSALITHHAHSYTKQVF